MKKFFDAVEKNRELILNAFDYIWKNPETGYREWKTTKYLEEAFVKLGYTLEKPENIPGFCACVDTGRSGPELLILGEMDSLIVPNHKDADPETGAVHSCGHCAQSAALLGIAAALKEPGVLDGMCGKIRLCAVPAEELIEIEYRNELKNQGVIKYFGGKSEFMYRGYFKDVDLAFMVHTSQGGLAARIGFVGCVAKKITYKGVSAHAGGSPWNGVNALYAANLGLNAINAIRETFKENDIIRVHPIITKGGSAVNAIPDTVTVESYVRGKTLEAIRAANEKVNRALVGGALSLGANIEINDIPGYSPLVNDKNMVDIAREAAEITFPELEFAYDERFGSGSTDMGDLSAVMPVVHPYVPGAKGLSHGENYEIADPDTACVGSAKWQLVMLSLLLSDNAERAKKIIAEHEPLFPSQKAYFEYMDTIDNCEDKIIYTEDGAEVKLK